MIVLRKIGQASNIDFVDALQGVKNGNNKTFVTPRRYKAGKINVLLNGQVLNRDDFSESGVNQVTLTWIAPRDFDKVGAIYEIDES